MSNYNPVYKSLWTSQKFAQLDLKAKLVYIYLITNERTQSTGIYQILPKQIACDCDLTAEEVTNALKKFIEVGLIRHWPKENHIFIYKYFKYAKGMIKNPTILNGCLKRQQELINNKEAWELFSTEYKKELEVIDEALIKQQTNKNKNNNNNNFSDNNINENKAKPLEELV